MKKAKVLIALMLVVSLVFPSVGMAAGGAKASNGTKEVSGKPEIKILDCQWYYSDYGDNWNKINNTFDFNDVDDNSIDLKNEIKIKSNQKLEGDIYVDYSLGATDYTYYIYYHIEPTETENVYLLTNKNDYIYMNKYNTNKEVGENKNFQVKCLDYSNNQHIYEYNLDELLSDTSNNVTAIKFLNMMDDFEAPVVKNISITRPEGDLKASDNICIEAEIEEDISGVNYVWLHYDCIYDNDNKDRNYSIPLEHERGNTYVYEGEAFDEGYPPNKIKLDNLWVEDNAGNSCSYGYEEDIENEISKLPVDIDLDMTFSDGNDSEDTKAPILKDIKVTNNKGVEKHIFDESEKPVTITAIAEDDKSGIEDVDIYYRDKDTKKLYMDSLEENDKSFSSEWLNDGSFELDKIEIVDKYGNSNTYTYTGFDDIENPCKKLEKNIDFTINIDKPVLTDIKVTDENGKEKYTFDENDEYCYIEALAEDEGSGVESVEVYYKNSRTGDVDEFYLSDYDNGKFYTEEYLSGQPKNYTLEKVVVYDNYENTSTYTYNGIDEYGEKCEKLPNNKNIDLTFKNGSDETVAPTLESFSIDNSEVTAPGTIKGKIKVTDNESSYMEVGICYENINDPCDEIYFEEYAIENNVESEFSYEIYNDNFKSSEYRLKYIKLSDKNNNTVYYGDEKDLAYYDEEHREFHNKIDQKNIKIKNIVYTDVVELSDLKYADVVGSFKENSRICVLSEFGQKITARMLKNIKNANKNIEFVFDIVENEDVVGYCYPFVFNSNSITDEYIKSLAGKGISLDIQYDEDYDESFRDIAKNVVGEESWNKLDENWVFYDEINEEEGSKQARDIFIKSNCENLIPFVEAYAKKQNMSFYRAARTLLYNWYTIIDTGNNTGIKFPKGSRFVIDRYSEDDLETAAKPYKVYYAGDDFNNLKLYESSTLNIDNHSVVIEDPGTYFITRGTLGYKDALLDISTATVSGITDRTYTGGAITQNPIVSIDGKNLVKDRDYTVSYENNVNAGTAKVIIKGKGAYTGQIAKTFTISKQTSSLNVPTVTFHKKYGDSRFNLGVSANTTVSYVSSNSNVASVDQSGNVTIKGAGIANITVTALGNGNYNPVQKTVAISVAKGNGSVKASSYKKARNSKKFKLNAKSTTGGKLTYSTSNKKVATVSKSGYVTIKGIGKTTITVKSAATANYNSTSKKITVTVVPKTMKISKVKAGKKSMKVYWSKDKEVSGYQVVIAKDKKFKKGKKTYKLSKNKYTSKSISKLSKKKNYYVKMRSYKKVGKTYYYSNYSSVKKIKTK